MIFTLYYMYSTIMQWWRLGSLRNKLSGTLNSHNALMVCTGNTISDSKNRRCLENLLFHNEDRIGCTVVPKQHIDLSHWIAFPKDYNYFPIFISDSKTILKSPKIYLWIQAQLSDYKQHQSEIVQVEHFGELVAWRAPEHFEIILKTDINNLTKFVNCFSDHGIDINHELKLLRIETINVDGNPTKIKYDLRYSLEQRIKYSLAPIHWKKFVNEIKILDSRFTDLPSCSKILDHPTIKIESSSKVEETRKVPVSEVKPIKKSIESMKHHHKTQRKESRNKLDVTSLDTRRPKSNDRKFKTEKAKESSDQKKKEHKTKTDHSGMEVGHKNDSKVESDHKPKDSEGGEPREKTKAPKLAECSSSSDHKPKPKLKKIGRHRSKDQDGDHKRLTLNGHTTVESGITNDDLKTNEELKTNAESTDVNNLGVGEAREGKLVNLVENKHSKPPNVLVYADSIVARDNVKNVLHAILNNHM